MEELLSMKDDETMMGESGEAGSELGGESSASASSSSSSFISISAKKAILNPGSASMKKAKFVVDTIKLLDENIYMDPEDIVLVSRAQ